METAAVDGDAPLRAAKHLYGGAAVTVFARPLMWVVSFGMIGPFLGLVEFPAYEALGPGPTATDVWLSTSFGLAGLGVVLAIVRARRLRQPAPAPAKITKVLAAAFLLDSVAYLIGLIVGTAYLIINGQGLVAISCAMVAVAGFCYPVYASLIVFQSGVAETRTSRARMAAVTG